MNIQDIFEDWGMFTVVMFGISHDSVLISEWCWAHPSTTPTNVYVVCYTIRPSSLTSRNPDAAGLIVFRESHHCSDQHLCHMGVSSGSRVDDSSQMAVGGDQESEPFFITWYEYSYHSIRSFSLGWISITKRGQKHNSTQRGEGVK